VKKASNELNEVKEPKPDFYIYICISATITRNKTGYFPTQRSLSDHRPGQFPRPALPLKREADSAKIRGLPGAAGPLDRSQAVDTLKVKGRPPKEMPSSISTQPIPPCPHCHSKFTIKKGRRLNRFRVLQVLLESWGFCAILALSLTSPGPDQLLHSLCVEPGSFVQKAGLPQLCRNSFDWQRLCQGIGWFLDQAKMQWRLTHHQAVVKSNCLQSKADWCSSHNRLVRADARVKVAIETNNTRS
jgi:hypothetical protein